MPTTKRIVCLANLRKLHDRCIAGREIVSDRPADWIRPVSAWENQEVSEYECQYENGRAFVLLDIHLGWTSSIMSSINLQIAFPFLFYECAKYGGSMENSRI